MNRIEIENGHWVERYLAGRLSELEAQRFEAYWVENPELLRDIEASARLKGGLAELRARGELERLLRPAWWPGRLRLLVLAACAVLVAVGLSTWRGASTPGVVPLAASASALASLDGAALPRGGVFPLMRLRSAGAVDLVLELPARAAALELRVLPEVPADGAPPDAAPAQYTLSLAAEGAAAPGHVAGPFAVGADGFVAVFVDSRALRAGRYRLRLEPVGAAPGTGGSGFLIDVRDGGAARP